MARTGLYKSDIKRARDALLEAGRYPSLDAMRIALGNTGSKTTIHRYLKELEAEEGVASKNLTLNEELQALVAHLAERLQGQADARVAALTAVHTEQAKQYAETQRGLEQALATGRAQTEALERQLAAAQDRIIELQQDHQQETLARHTAEQRADALTERLSENEAHRRSLEEKHTHAREALEHFRQAAKEQRDQEQRRHEHQMQQLQVEIRELRGQLVGKQEEIARLNQDGARLVGDLRHARQALSEYRQEAAHKEAELAGQLTALRDVAGSKIQLLQQQQTEARMEVAGQGREIKLLQKELGRMQTLHDRLSEEKTIWRHERVQMEEMLKQYEQQSGKIG